MLKTPRLERCGLPGGASAPGFASVKTMGMLLFASMGRGPSPHLTVLKCHEAAGSNR